MYCSGCGLALPSEALSCSSCGKRCIQDEPVSDPVPEATLLAAEGHPLDGRRSPESDSPTKPESGVPSTVGERNRLQRANAGSITLGAVALICLALGAVQGFIPIFLIEGAVFGGLAWLCAAKWPLPQSLHAVVLVASLLLAGLVGVTLDQDSFGPRYRYLSQGSSELRVDEKAGRTDRLGSGGWHPVAFDKAAEQLPPSDVLVFDFALKDGHWGPNWPSGDEICFTFENSSGYVIQKLSVQIEVKDKDGKEAKDVSQVIDLAREGGGLIDTGETSKVCALAPGNYPEGGNWSFTDVGAYGWKR
jgi:hypothetical protein